MAEVGEKQGARVGRIDPSSPEVPTRVIVRIACDFLLGIEADGIRRLGSIQRDIILTAIIVANVQHITRSAIRSWRYARLDQVPPDSERRPVSIRGLSQSLNIPFETTRAHINALISDGLCIRADHGVVVRSDVLLSGRSNESGDFLWDSFWEMIEKLRSIDFDFNVVIGAEYSNLMIEETFSPSDVTTLPRRIISRVISDFYVTAIVEAIAPHGDDMNTGAIFASFMILNSKSLSLDAEMAWQYSTADTTPPDHIRAPATITDVAKRLGLNHELVRRKTHDLLAAGRLERRGRGFLVSMTHMQGENSRAGGAAIVLQNHHIY